MSLLAALTGKVFSLLPVRWLALAAGAALLLTAGYLYLRWQGAENSVVRLGAELALVRSERDLARADQEVLRRVAASLRGQLERSQALLADYAAGTAADRSRLESATLEPAKPGEVVDDATNAWALDRLDALFD